MKFLLLIIILLQDVCISHEQQTHSKETCHTKMDNIICIIKDKLNYVNTKLHALQNQTHQGTKNCQLTEEMTSQVEDLTDRVADIEEAQRKILNFNKQIETRIQNLEKYAEQCTQSADLPTHHFPHECSELQVHGQSGVYTIYPDETQTPVSVYCDMETDGGGWTVIQRRQDGSTNFHRNWTEYKSGFGDLLKEYWLGNDIISDITRRDQQDGYSLLVTLTDFANYQANATYRNFSVAGVDKNYTLNLEFVNGTAGDSLSFHNGMDFSTYDVDNDEDWYGNCAAYWGGGGFWYKNCFNACLNCPYCDTEQIQYGRGITWMTWTGMLRSLKGTEMKIRPQNFNG